MKKLTLVHAACFAVCAASPLLAQSQNQSINNQPSSVSAPMSSSGDIVVTATRTEQRIQDALPAMTLISRADIDRSLTSDLPTLLRQVGGLEIAQTGGPGSQASAFMRGANSNHTLVLVDGVPINNLNFGTAALEHISLVNVERIEIVRGNVSSLYGSAAIGGVIQVFTRQGGAGNRASVSVQKGSNNLTAFSASASSQLATETRISASVENLSDGGINAINQAKRPLTNPDQDGYKRSAYTLGVVQDIGKDHQVGLSVRSAKGRTQFDSEFGSVAASQQLDEASFESQATLLHGRFKLSTDLSLKLSHSDSSEKYNNDVSAYPFFVTSKTKQTNAGLDWALTPSQVMTLGLDQQTQGIESGTAYSANTRKLDGLRLGYRAFIGSHQIQLNLRQDQYSDFGKAATHYAGYAYRLNSFWRVNVATSTGFNAPTFNDLFYPFGSGNTNLRPERVDSNEVGLQYTGQQSEARVVWFQNRFRDLIVNNAAFQRENIERASNGGMEFTSKTVFGVTTLNAGLTLQDPKNQTKNTQLLRRAQTLGFVNLQRDMGAWQLGGNMRHTGSRLDIGSKTLAAYNLLDLTAAYKLNKSTKLTARLDNASNETYENVFGYNMPRRGVFVGVNWQL
jgi:vitamin B12 transporter